MKKSMLILMVFAFMLIAYNAEARKIRYNQYWTITSATGLSLFYGDMSDTYATVFHKFMDKNQLGYGTGLNFRYRFLPYFGMNAKVQISKVRGKRTAWSNGHPVFYDFEGNMEEVSISGDIDMLDLVGLRIPWLSLYAKGGVGILFHQSTNHNFLFDIDIYDKKKTTPVLPFGGGARVYLTKNIGLQFETTWHYALSDELDGYAGMYGEVNDMYTFTSLGFIFKFNSKSKKASYSNTFTTYRDSRTFYKHKRFTPGRGRDEW